MNKKNNSEKHSYILTKETMGMTILLFSFILTVMLLSNDLIFLGLGKAVCTFMYGTFGYASYFIVAMLAYLGERLVFEKKLKINLKIALCVSATVAMLFFLFHSVTTAGYSMDGYGKYLQQCYLNAAEGYKGYSFGGVISGLIVYPIAKGTKFIGAYVIFAILSALLGVLSFFVIRKVVLSKLLAKAGANAEDGEDAGEVVGDQEQTPDNLYTVNENHEIVTNVKSTADVSQPAQAAEAAAAAAEERPAAASDQRPENDKYSRENLGRKILFEPGEFAAESYRRNMIYNENSYFNHPVNAEKDYIKSFSGATPAKQESVPVETGSYMTDYSAQVENGQGGPDTPSYLYGDAPVENLSDALNESDSSAAYDSYTVNGNTAADEEAAEPENETADDYNTLKTDYAEPVKPARVEEDNRAVGFTAQVNNTSRRNETENFVADEPEPQPTPAEPAEEEKPRERNTNIFSIFNAANPRINSQRGVEPEKPAQPAAQRESSRENLFDDDGDDEEVNLFGDESPLVSGARTESGRGREGGSAGGITPVTPARVTPEIKEKEEVKAEEPKPVEEKPKHVWKKYVRPSIDLLDDYPENTNVNTGEIEESKQIIVETLTNFRIASQVSNVVVGPAITRYDVIIEDKTNIKNALKYREAIAMALMKENVTAYLNYSKGAISIEVPNSSRCVVGLKTMLTSSQFLNSKPNSLTFTLGKNVEGQVVCPDITKMPHLLVAGTTGSGKSICLSTLIISLLYKYGPEELRFILVDPKQVEFISYDKLPHLMINEIIYDVDKAIKALNWAIKEMEHRYQLFKEMTESGIATKNLTEYNAHLPEGEEKLPKIVIILDEFGDLMLQAKKDIESRIIRLVQKARACGIHLILATQRPSVDCITGLIKSNLPTRIGFKVNSFDDARTIFDIGGAEKLLGKGDMYYRSAENPELARIQGCFVDTHEVQKVTDFIKQNNETYFDQSVSDFINTVEEEPSDDVSDEGVGGGDTAKVDDTFIKALKFCVTSNQASVSMIQRRFPIGYMKACKIIDWMENMNYITQSEGSKPRKVLLSREEFIQRYGDIDD